jgi:hypothetical protein
MYVFMCACVCVGMYVCDTVFYVCGMYIHMYKSWKTTYISIDIYIQRYISRMAFNMSTDVQGVELMQFISMLTRE